jgi:hypothetical protein
MEKKEIEFRGFIYFFNITKYGNIDLEGRRVALFRITNYYDDVAMVTV